MIYIITNMWVNCMKNRHLCTRGLSISSQNTQLPIKVGCGQGQTDGEHSIEGHVKLAVKSGLPRQKDKMD